MDFCRFCLKPTSSPYGFCSDECYTGFQQGMEDMADALGPHPEKDFDMRNPDGSYMNSEDVYGVSPESSGDEQPNPDYYLGAF